MNVIKTKDEDATLQGQEVKNEEDEEENVN